MSKVTQYYRNNILHIYSYFKLENCDNLDYSEKAIVEMFEHESLGKEINTKTNGYYHCKRNLDITLANWTETLKDGLTTKYEIMSNYENDQVMYDFVKDFYLKFIFLLLLIVGLEKHIIHNILKQKVVKTMYIMLMKIVFLIP